MTMYCSLAQNGWDNLHESGAWQRGLDPVLRHRGDYERVLVEHRQHVAAATRGDMPPVAAYLKNRIADTRTMRCALDHILAHGGDAPGVDRLRPSDLTYEEGWSLCRALSKAVRDGTYLPGPDRLCPIPKRPGSSETRTLTIQIVADRIVAGAVRLIIQPVVDPMLSPFAFARPDRGPQHALATALALGRRGGGHWVWIAEDIKGFYDNIPFSRLVRAVQFHLPDAGNLVEFIKLISHTGKKRGIRQGSSVSPLLAHVFRDHQIAAPWQRRLPETPLVSYLDDLLIACRTVEQAKEAYDTLSLLVTSAGLRLKGSPESTIRNLADGQDVTYVGYHLQRRGRSLAITIADRAWCNLEDGFIEAHEGRAPPRAADDVVLGWLNYLGPCYRDEDRDAALDRLYASAATFGFEELPDRPDLLGRWFAAYGRWRRLAVEEEEKLGHRLNLSNTLFDGASP